VLLGRYFARGERIFRIGGLLSPHTLYLQETRGFSALHAGLLTLPMAA